MQETEKEMVTHSSVLAWRIPRTEEPGGLQPMRSQESDTTWRLNHHHHQWRSCKRLGFNPWVRKIPCRRKWQPAPIFLPWKAHRGAWRATVHGLTKRWTWLSDWAPDCGSWRCLVRGSGICFLACRGCRSAGFGPPGSLCLWPGLWLLTPTWTNTEDMSLGWRVVSKEALLLCSKATTAECFAQGESQPFQTLDLE